ncbi:hypothetical protein BsWGS_10987 [Bradybaena similaris]
MAEVESKASDGNEENIRPVRTQGILDSENSTTVTLCVREGQESDATEGGKKEGEIQAKEQELPELIRHKHESKRMMPCLPSINLLELTTILRDPNMPSKKILNEVADKIMSKSEESESDDGSVSSGGGVVGMKGVLDYIFEVSYMHEDSDSSDDDDGSFEKFPREIPCTFCNKIFGSTMTWNTHVLVAHPHQEHSVHNIRKTSVSESDRKEKSHPYKKYPRGSSKSECDARDIKVHYASAKMKQASECNKVLPVHKRHSSFSKSQYREGDKCDYKHQLSSCQLKSESLSTKEVSCSISPCGLIQQGEEVATSVCQKESVESGAKSDLPCQAFDKISTVESESECVSASSSSQLQGVESTCLNQCSSEVKDEAEVQQNSGAALDAHAPANSTGHARDLSENSKCGRKRRTTPELPESTSVSSLSPKRSRKTISKD